MSANHYMKLINRGNLRSLMSSKSFSAERLARYAGCSKSFIIHLRVGRKSTCTPRLGTRIAEALDIPVELLFLEIDSFASGTHVPQTPRSLAA